MFAHFIGESLKKTKTREFVPSQEEIMALLTRQEMTTTVYCHGGGSCKISINSHTTAGEVTITTWATIFASYSHKHTEHCDLDLLCPGGGEANQRSGYGGQQKHVCTL